MQRVIDENRVHIAESSSTSAVAIIAAEETFTTKGALFTPALQFSDGRKKMQGNGHACMAGEPITSGVYRLTVEFGSSGDAFQSIGIADSTLLTNALVYSTGKATPFFGLANCKMYRNGNLYHGLGCTGESAFDLRGETVTMALDMDSRSVSFRLASGGKEYTMGDLPSSVHPVCGVNENWVHIVESSSSSSAQTQSSAAARRPSLESDLSSNYDIMPGPIPSSSSDSGPDENTWDVSKLMLELGRLRLEDNRKSQQLQLQQQQLHHFRSVRILSDSATKVQRHARGFIRRKALLRAAASLKIQLSSRAFLAGRVLQRRRLRQRSLERQASLTMQALCRRFVFCSRFAAHLLIGRECTQRWRAIAIFIVHANKMRQLRQLSTWRRVLAQEACALVGFVERSCIAARITLESDWLAQQSKASLYSQLKQTDKRAQQQKAQNDCMEVKLSRCMDENVRLHQQLHQQHLSALGSISKLCERGVTCGRT
jgi:hypothetical protein